MFTYLTMTIVIQSQINQSPNSSMIMNQKPKRRIIKKKRNPLKETQSLFENENETQKTLPNEPLKKKRKIIKKKKVDRSKVDRSTVLPMTPPSSIGSDPPKNTHKDNPPQINISSTVCITPPISRNTSNDIESELEENKEAENLDGKGKPGLLTKENLLQHTKSFTSVYDMETDVDDDNESDLEEVLVVNWKCASTNLYYLLDPITQEVYDKVNRNLIGIRYKSDDERSLIDYI